MQLWFTMFLCVGPFNQLSRGSRRFPPAQGGGPSRRGKEVRDPPLFHQLQGRFLVRRVCYCLLVGYVDEIPATYKQPAFIGAEDWGCEVHRWLIAWWENASYIPAVSGITEKSFFLLIRINRRLVDYRREFHPGFTCIQAWMTTW